MKYYQLKSSWNIRRIDGSENRWLVCFYLLHFLLIFQIFFSDVPDKFDLETFLNDLTEKDFDEFIQENLYFLSYSAVVGFAASLIVSIISIFHFRFVSSSYLNPLQNWYFWRLLRRLNGKKFVPFINDVKKVKKKKNDKYLQASAAISSCDPKSILILRTLESRNRHTSRR